jgi:pimeloyl-ACP methyl ester carboxylesterase
MIKKYYSNPKRFDGNKARSHRHTDFKSLRDHVPSAEIIKFQECGHFPDLERPQEYASHIKRFVNSATL